MAPSTEPTSTSLPGEPEDPRTATSRGNTRESQIGGAPKS